MGVYRKATEVYPNDYRGFNNLGLTQYVAKDYNAAAANFDRAARLAPDSKEVAMNKGLVDMLRQNYTTANVNFGTAAGVPEAADALGVYYLSQGDNAKAVNAFGDIKTNNAAVAQILAKDYSKAKQTLAAIPHPDATTYYLTAILGARTGNENMVMSNLRQAARLDSSLISRAKSDKEFANYNLSFL